MTIKIYLAIKALILIILLTVVSALNGCVNQKKVTYVWQNTGFVNNEYRLLQFDSKFWANRQTRVIKRRKDGIYYSPVMYKQGSYYIVIFPETIDVLHKRFKDRIKHPEDVGL